MYPTHHPVGMGDDRTNLKIDSELHERLERLKRKGDTWDDLLERLADQQQAEIRVQERLDTLMSQVEEMGYRIPDRTSELLAEELRR